MQLRFHTQVAGSTLAATQVDNNVVRVALQALAAVLGGTQSLHTNAKDEALGLPTEETATLALRTQQVIALESGVADFVDPLGGSHAIEEMTDALEADAAALIQKVDSLGGMVQAIEAGFPQREIQNAAYAHQVGMEKGDTLVVGVNVYAEEGGEMPEILAVDPALEEDQVARLAALRSGRDAGRARECVDALQQAAAGNGPLMEHIVDAVRARCTLGEIADALRAEFGEYRESVVL
jgi:methylmalonyl-CoA mutase N-terminal domain/subunit